MTRAAAVATVVMSPFRVDQGHVEKRDITIAVHHAELTASRLTATKVVGNDDDDDGREKNRYPPSWRCVALECLQVPRVDVTNAAGLARGEPRDQRIALARLRP
jgi:hypothetical protein